MVDIYYLSVNTLKLLLFTVHVLPFNQMIV